MKIFIVLVFVCTSISAQVADTVYLAQMKSARIDSIKIIGNNQTKDFIILRELSFKVGDVVQKPVMEFNKERVYSLGLFNFVRFFLVKEKGLIILNIEVEESWYIYPIPFLSFYGSGYKNAQYGIDFLLKNFRGRNESLRIDVGLGYDPFLLVYYYNPAFWGLNQFLFAPSFYYGTPINKSSEAVSLTGKDFDYKIINTRLGFGKRFSQFMEGFVTFGHAYAESKYAIKGISATGRKIDNSFSFGFTGTYDTRNLKQFPESGILAIADFQRFGLFNKDINYSILKVDYRHYRPIRNWFSFRWRLMARNSFGSVIPFYNYSFFGYDEYVRGHKNDYREGKNLAFGAFEVSIPLLKEKEISVDIPKIPKKLTSARLDIQLILFYDHGFTYKKAISFDKENYYSGYGIGVTFLILPFNAIRIEYALNEKAQGEFIIGAGFSF